MSKDQNPSDKACDAYFDNPYAATSGSYYSDRVTFYAGFAAGAASRDAEVYTKQGAIDMLNQWNDELLAQIKQKDAEVARLKSVPMKYRRMAFNAQLQNENAQLRTQINTLTEALEFCSGTSYIDDAHKMANETLALIGSTT